MPTADPISRPPTTFQERVASAKLASASKRSTPTAAATPAPRPTRSNSQRHDSLTTLDPDKLASLLGTKAKLCNLVPAGLDTRSSSDAYSDDEDAAKTPTNNRTKTRRRVQKAAVQGSSDEDERPKKDKENKSKRKLNMEKIDSRPISHIARDDKTKTASVKTNEKENRRKTKKEVAEEGSKTTKTHRQSGSAGPRTLPVFNLGEYPAATAERSSRLDAIKKSVERAHKNQRQAERKSQKQAALTGVGERGGRRGDVIGTRKTLRSDALLAGKTQFVKLKVQG